MCSTCLFLKILITVRAQSSSKVRASGPILLEPLAMPKEEKGKQTTEVIPICADDRQRIDTTKLEQFQWSRAGIEPFQQAKDGEARGSKCRG